MSKISEFAESQGVHGQLTVVINVYVNKHGLAKTLQVRFLPFLPRAFPSS